MPATLEGRLITFLLGLLGSAFGAGVIWGVTRAELSGKADKSAVIAYEVENTIQHTAITVQLKGINDGVAMLRLISCEDKQKDSYCRAKPKQE